MPALIGCGTECGIASVCSYRSPTKSIGCDECLAEREGEQPAITAACFIKDLARQLRPRLPVTVPHFWTTSPVRSCLQFICADGPQIILVDCSMISNAKINSCPLGLAQQQFEHPRPKVFELFDLLEDGGVFLFFGPLSPSLIARTCVTVASRSFSHFRSPFSCGAIRQPPRLRTTLLGESAGWCGPILRCPALNAETDLMCSPYNVRGFCKLVLLFGYHWLPPF
jgi:hypothetical protein